MTRARSDHAVLRLGAITLVVLLVVMAASFNLQKFPGFRGQSYEAEFSDASGLRVGQMVQIAGQKVGRVNELRLESDRVVVEFDAEPGVEFGSRTSASVEVLNLLGEKYLELQPAGDDTMKAGGRIPMARTDSAYDIVGVLSDLTETTEGIDSAQLGKALDLLAQTLSGSSQEIRSTFRGVSRLSRAIASRDEELRTLLGNAEDVSGLLAERRTDLVGLMDTSSQVFETVQQRSRDIHTLLVNTRALAEQLEGLVADNRRDLAPALAQLRGVTKMLKAERRNLQKTAAAMGPYTDILVNILGTGPWFDAYLANLVGLGTGEFVPGPRGGGDR